MGKRINGRDLGRALRRKHVGNIALAVHADNLALRRKAHIDALRDRLEREHAALARHVELERAVVQRGHLHHLHHVLKFIIEAARARTVRAPAIAPGPGVEPACARAAVRVIGLFLQQRLGNCSGHGQTQADLLLLEQHGLFARNQRGVEIGLHERAALHDVAQELHVGVEPDDVSVGQGRI